MKISANAYSLTLIPVIIFILFLAITGCRSGHSIAASGHRLKSAQQEPVFAQSGKTGELPSDSAAKGTAPPPASLSVHTCVPAKSISINKKAIRRSIPLYKIPVYKVPERYRIRPKNDDRNPEEANPSHFRPGRILFPLLLMLLISCVASILIVQLLILILQPLIPIGLSGYLLFTGYIFILILVPFLVLLLYYRMRLAGMTQQEYTEFLARMKKRMVSLLLFILIGFVGSIFIIFNLLESGGSIVVAALLLLFMEFLLALSVFLISKFLAYQYLRTLYK
jgi:hypothetical protein